MLVETAKKPHVAVLALNVIALADDDAKFWQYSFVVDMLDMLADEVLRFEHESDTKVAMLDVVFGVVMLCVTTRLLVVMLKEFTLDTDSVESETFVEHRFTMLAEFELRFVHATVTKVAMFDVVFGVVMLCVTTRLFVVMLKELMLDTERVWMETLVDDRFDM